MRPLFVWSLVVAAALPPLPASAQQKALPPVDSNSVIVIGRTKGRDVSGRVVAIDDTSLTIVTLKSKQVVLPRRSLESWHVRRGILTAKGFRDTDLNTHRLIFGPTARTLERGASYLETYFMFVWAGTYGVSDRVMISGGTAIGESWDSTSAHPTGANGPAWLDARVGIIRSPKAAVALGALWGTWTGPGGGSLGNAYAVVTLGSNDHAVTVMGGYPFARNNVANEPTFMVGGETRFASHLKLIAEAWRVPETPGAHAGWGVRWFNDRLAVSVGGIHRLDSQLRAFPVLPWLDVAFRP